MKNVKVMLFLGLSIIAPMAQGMFEENLSGKKENNLSGKKENVEKPSMASNFKLGLTRSISRKPIVTSGAAGYHFTPLNSLDATPGMASNFKLESRKSISRKPIVTSGAVGYLSTPLNSLDATPVDSAVSGVAPVDSAKKWSRNQKAGLGAGAAVIAAGGLYLGRKGYQKYKKWKREQEELKRKAAEPVIEDIEIVEDAEEDAE